MKSLLIFSALNPTIPSDLSGTPSSIGQLAKNITNTLLLLIGIVAVIMIIIGGFQYIMSTGDQNRTRVAKDTILYAVIGLVVAVLAYSIVNFVLGRF